MVESNPLVLYGVATVSGHHHDDRSGDAQGRRVSRRQAYRYLQEAAGLSDPVPAVEPTVAITFKLPVSTVRAIRSYARRSRLSLGQVVAQAVTALLDSIRQRRG